MSAKGLLTFLSAVASMVLSLVTAQAQSARPNILAIFADDVGIWNISAYHRGMMGGRTPNIDELAKKGALFTDYYSQNSCTAGRAAFITGQNPLRTGLLKVGLPGAKQGLQDKDPTIAELLKAQGYATAQIGKNHLGDRNEFLPTRHGFDEFYGNLYHLNSEEEPEDADYPKDPKFHAMFGPRGLLDVKASDKDDPTEDPRFGRVGKQMIKDTGPLTRKRMETAEEELLARSLDFIDRSVKANKPPGLLTTNCTVTSALADLPGTIPIDKCHCFTQRFSPTGFILNASDSNCFHPIASARIQVKTYPFSSMPEW